MTTSGGHSASARAGANEGAPRKRGPYAKTDALRTKILDAAIAVFARSGYRGGSIQEIADLVGMSQPGLLYHFENKQALLGAVLERWDTVNVDAFPTSPDDPCATLLDLVQAYAQNTRKPGLVELFCTIAAEATAEDHPANAYFRHRYNAFRTTLRTAFAGLELCPGLTPESAAIATVSLMDGLQIQWLLEPPSVDMPTELLRYFDTVVVSAEWRRRRPSYRATVETCVQP